MPRKNSIGFDQWLFTCFHVYLKRTREDSVMAVKQSMLDFYGTSVNFSKDEDRNEVFNVLRTCNVKGPVVSTDLGGELGYMFVFLGPDGG
jgi:hypothetical protein